MYLNSPGIVEHWEETNYIKVEYEVKPTPETQCLLHFSSNLPKQEYDSKPKINGDFFLPLGWLVETDKNGSMFATRYVCMLNISTKPLSLWLMFDYLIKDYRKSTIISDLSRIYDNGEEGVWSGLYATAKNMIGDKDLVLVYKDVKD